jgi:hypothetical protein
VSCRIVICYILGHVLRSGVVGLRLVVTFAAFTCETRRGMRPTSDRMELLSMWGERDVPPLATRGARSQSS